MKLVFLIAVCCYFPRSIFGLYQSPPTTWDYADFARWGQVSSICSTGFRQSPIDLRVGDAFTDNVRLVSDPIRFEHYFEKSLRLSGTLENTGTGIRWTVDPTNVTPIPRFIGTGLRTWFILAEVHFHWGASEHVIEDSAAPMEVHLIHYNSKYGSFAKAASQNDGLAVVALLLTPYDAPIQRGDVDYTDIAIEIPKVAFPDSKVKVTLNSANLLPAWATYSAFFRYVGSLTTPPCSENVIWTVYRYRPSVSATILNALRGSIEPFWNPQPGIYGRMSNGTFAPFLSNVRRPLQTLHGRTVTTNDKAAGRLATLPPASSASRLETIFITACLIGVVLAAK